MGENISLENTSTTVKYYDLMPENNTITYTNYPITVKSICFNNRNYAITTENYAKRVRFLNGVRRLYRGEAIGDCSN